MTSHDDRSPSHAALELARAAHHDQERPTDGAPYVDHPVEVAEILRCAGFSETVRAAAILHDVVERSDLDVARIEQQFGARVAELVGAMTEGPQLSGYRERKTTHRERIAAVGREAAAIFVADKLANARELRRALERGRADLLERLPTSVDDRLWHYSETLALMRRVHPDLPLLDDLDRELAKVRAALERR